ncbi:hypothetical protein [Rhodococcus sp. NPDC058514]|uniref:hypothetical protein n=1 Tax=unclassified Rhodococcus (in: high G+C Gram-positive bacteria) TaxID=192944 RepID=UPI0036636382
MTNPDEFENPATDRNAAAEAMALACCGTERQTTCCDHSEKATCCGPVATANGGCGCQ